MQSAGHRECTKLRGALAIEAESLSDFAHRISVLHQVLCRLQMEFDQQLHAPPGNTLGNTPSNTPQLKALTASSIYSNSPTNSRHKFGVVGQPSPLLLSEYPRPTIAAVTPKTTKLPSKVHVPVLPPGNTLLHVLDASQMPGTAEKRLRAEFAKKTSAPTLSIKSISTVLVENHPTGTDFVRSPIPPMSSLPPPLPLPISAASENIIATGDYAPPPMPPPPSMPPPPQSQ